MQKIKKIVIKTLKIFFLTIVGLHLALRITAFFEPPVFKELLFLTDEFVTTGYHDERFTHKKWMNIKIGTHKSEVEKIIKGEDFFHSKCGEWYGVDLNSPFTTTSYSYDDNSRIGGYIDYDFCYDENQILIAKRYQWYYE
ncbi:MAG: hypothetical protein MUC49_19390 [Raineya sp.]|jgi:hypothetical protein|nr:hypothetical protein [Raineya sp.]